MRQPPDEGEHDEHADEQTGVGLQEAVLQRAGDGAHVHEAAVELLLDW